jgi:hypothetical protein
MLKFYRDFNSHIAAVYSRENGLAFCLKLDADGIKCFVVPQAEFAKKYTHPLTVDSRKAAFTWLGRALTKTRNDLRALQLLGEFTMDKNYMEMTMDEIVEYYNDLATARDLPTVETFKTLKAARTAVDKLLKPVAQKEPKATANPEALGRGPVQGIGAFAKQLILEGGSNKEVHAAVLENFPTAKTSVACIAYYRSKLVLEGKLPKSPRGAKPAVEEAEAA